MHARTIGVAAFLSCQLALASSQALGQTKPEEERVDVIISHAEEAGPQRRSLRTLFAALKARFASIRSHVLPLTRCEKWSVAKKDLERVKREAAKQGVVVTQLGADWRQLMHAADETQLDEKQKALVDRAKASSSTLGVKIMRAPPPAILEHALTTDVKNPDGTSQPATITVAFADNTTITIVRSSLDLKPDMCIWRGTVEGTEAQVTLMWWANGKMTGTVQGRGRPQSIRHLGGRLYAVVEMGEDRMPQEHAPMAQGARDDPTLRDDPLVRQGDASSIKARKAAQSSTATPLGDAKQKVAPAAPPGKDVTIDVIVAYTKKAASSYSDVKRELVDLSIEEANNSFRMSHLGNIKLRLVHSYQTDYVEQGAAFDH